MFRKIPEPEFLDYTNTVLPTLSGEKKVGSQVVLLKGTNIYTLGNSTQPLGVSKVLFSWECYKY